MNRRMREKMVEKNKPITGERIGANMLPIGVAITD